MCRYHENIELLATSIHKTVPGLPLLPEDIVAFTVCSMDTETCVDRECENCGVDQLDQLFPGDTSAHCVYYQWITSDDGVVRKQAFEEDLESARQKLLSQLATFARHCYNAKRQHREMRHLKDNLPCGEVIIHEDFAENYSLRQ